MPNSRPMEWFTTLADGQTVTSGGQSNNELLVQLAESIRKGSTITRILLQLVIHPATVNTICRLKWGMVLVNEDAASGGTFPDADQSTDRADWLARGAELVSVTDLFNGQQYARVDRDLRAQRVIRADTDEFHFIIDQDSSGATVNYSVWTRVLIRLR